MGNLRCPAAIGSTVAVKLEVEPGDERVRSEVAQGQGKSSWHMMRQDWGIGSFRCHSCDGTVL